MIKFLLILLMVNNRKVSFMQSKKSVLLNKLLVYVPGSHELVGIVLQEMCWVLSSAETSSCSQKGEI